MSISEYLRGNETRMRQMRESGETWEAIASLVQNETGEEVNLASLRKTYSRLFGGSEAPVKVEKPVRQMNVSSTVRQAVSPKNEGDNRQDIDDLRRSIQHKTEEIQRLNDTVDGLKIKIKMMFSEEEVRKLLDLKTHLEKQLSDSTTSVATMKKSNDDMKENIKKLNEELIAATGATDEKNIRFSTKRIIAASVICAVVGGGIGAGSMKIFEQKAAPVIVAAKIEEPKPLASDIQLPEPKLPKPEPGKPSSGGMALDDLIGR
jgi:hypothetical protein